MTKKPDIKLIITDLDDTLLQPDSTFTDYTAEVVRAAMEKGVYFSIATGRMIKTALPIAKKLGANAPMLCCQGGIVADSGDGHILASNNVPCEIAVRVARYAEENGLYMQAFLPDASGYFITEECRFSQMYYDLNKVAGTVVEKPFSEFIDFNPAKVMFIGEREDIAALQDKVKAIFGGELQISTSKPNFLEMTHPRANKGEGVATVGRLLGIPKENIMAIGDGFNDLPMAKHAGFFVAVSNAPEGVRAAADYVSLSNIEDGAARAIEKFVL